jgi:hypothetical protein
MQAVSTALAESSREGVEANVVVFSQQSAQNWEDTGQNVKTKRK